MFKATMQAIAPSYQTCVSHHWKRHCQVLQIWLRKGNKSQTNIMNWQWLHVHCRMSTSVLVFELELKNYCCLKLFNCNKHGIFNLRPNSACGVVIATCNVQLQDATPTGWADIRPLIVRTHTDHCNNVIKTMQTRIEVRIAVCVTILFVNKTTHCISKIDRRCKWKNTEYWNVAWHWHGH